MRDVIEKIVETENKARGIVEEAWIEADRMLSDAQKKAREIVEQARQEVHLEAEKIIQGAVEKSEREKQQRLDNAAAEIEVQIQLEPASRKWAVEGVVRCVCKQP